MSSGHSRVTVATKNGEKKELISSTDEKYIRNEIDIHYRDQEYRIVSIEEIKE